MTTKLGTTMTLARTIILCELRRNYHMRTVTVTQLCHNIIIIESEYI